MADSDHVTVKEVNEAVLKIVQEGNQDAITTRSVTEDIVKMYGDRLGPLKEKIKAVVRAQLKVLVNSEIVTSKKTDSTPKKQTVNKEDVPSVTVENAKASTKGGGNATNIGDTLKKKKTKEDTEVTEIKDDEANPLEKEVPTKKENEGDTDGKKKAEPSADDDDEESKEDANDTDFKVDEEEEEEEKVVKRRRTRKRAPVEVEESAESAASSEEPISKRRRGRKSVAKMTPSEKRLKKYMKICSSIGCPVPPSKFRGLEVKEKIETVVQYLLEKGIDVKESIPTEKELRKLGSKFARQKELALLDESNIIETEGRRPRRNAAKNVSYSDNYEKEKAAEGENAEQELPPSSPEQMSDSEGYVASIASSDDDE